MSAAAPRTAPSAPYKATAKEVKRIMADRRKGLYICEDTFNEAWLAYKQMEKDDVAFTLHYASGTFRVMNFREFLTQLQMWKEIGVKCLECNVKEAKFGDKTAWMFVAQPKDLEEAPMCPLAMSLSTLVSGFTYIVKDKAIADLAVRALA